MRLLLLAIRSLQKYKLYTFLNILALGLSLTCVITLCRYIHQELTTDHFIRDLDRVYYIIEEREADQRRVVGEVSRDEPFNALLKHPAIEIQTRFINLGNDEFTFNDKKNSCNTLIVDSMFLQIITYPILQTSTPRLLSQPNEAVITKKFAKKLFGDKNPLGEILIHSTGESVTITGILDEPSTQISYPFDILIHHDLIPSWRRGYKEIIMLYPQVEAKEINKIFSQYKPLSGDREKIRYQLFPMKDFYFNNQIITYYDACIHGNKTNLHILFIVTLLLLTIGCFNFINTYTTLILKREREFGMKKVFGANPGQIYGQFLFENASMIFLALFFGWVMNELFSNLLWNYLGIAEVKNYFFNFFLSLTIFLILPVITTFYPFIRYYYSVPIQSLKQILISGKTIKTRNSLLFLQYLISYSLIIFSLFFIKQLNFMLNKDLGFNTNHIIKTKLLNDLSFYTPELISEYRNKKEFLKNELSQNTILKEYHWGKCPLDIHNQKYLLRKPGGEFIQINAFGTTRKGIDLWGITLLEGEIWEDRDDFENEKNILINETAWKLFEFTNLEDAYLETESPYVYTNLTDKSKTTVYKVSGIIKDFHIGHLANRIPPIAIFSVISDPSMYFYGLVFPEKTQEGIHFLKELNEKVDNREFNYTFISEQVKEIYQKDKQITMLCSLFAFFAICISALGLFSLSLFDIRQKLPEVGIRKVNGAQPRDIFRLFMRKYMMILLYAFVTACLLTRIGLYYYLQDFAYKTTVSWWIFAIAFIITAGITWLTLFYQIRKAAGSNPAEVIRSE